MIENSLKTTTERHISDRLVKGKRIFTGCLISHTYINMNLNPILAKSKLRIELYRETDLEESIKEQLDSAQLELEKAIIRQAKLGIQIKPLLDFLIFV